jgi:hemerythrin
VRHLDPGAENRQAGHKGLDVLGGFCHDRPTNRQPGDAMALQWREQLSVGNNLIDADHQRLIEIIGRAEASLQSRDRSALFQVLDELAQYGEQHFRREEALANAVGYPKVEPLHGSHEQLLADLSLFKSQIGDTLTEDVAGHIASFLHDWFINHVIKEDLPMKPWMMKFPASLERR